MKNTLYTALALLFMVGMQSCEKNELNLSNKLVTENGAYLKILWLSPSFNTQGVQVKIDGARVSNLLGLGYTSTSQYAMPFPGGGLNTGGNNKSDYLLVNAGELDLGVAVPKKGTNEDSIEVLKTTFSVEKGKYYSITICDSFPAAQSFLLPDEVNYADSGFNYLRFINTIPNAGANLDFLVTNTSGTDIVLASNIPYKGATAFLKVPWISGTNTFKLRKTGTTATYGTTYPTSSLTNKRGYTVAARGYNNGTGVRVPTLSIVYNK